MAKSLMIQGTASGVGKTIITLALCRIFKQDGYATAPFKAQNVTTNTWFTETGAEIAVSQWLQALAAGIKPSVEMNPVILKILPEQKATQIVVNGKHLHKINPYTFKDIKQSLVPEINQAYASLDKKYDALIIEGAGSPVELNLNQADIVNMGMAKQAQAPVILVADIDRGGAFASLYGTINLLPEAERAYVKAIIINRFKGDPDHFAAGVKIIEDITQLPVAGVVPDFKINLPEEDSLFDGSSSLDHSANFTAEFDRIAANMRQALNMDLIYQVLNAGVTKS